jgi:hypothetical protein
VLAMNNNSDKVERVIVAVSALALNCPSTFTIAWSKEEHSEELPVLYAGIITSAVTVAGAILGDKWHGTEIMWGGLLATLGLFGYIVFFYKPKKNGTVSPPLIIGDGTPSCPKTHEMLII